MLHCKDTLKLLTVRCSVCIIPTTTCNKPLQLLHIATSAAHQGHHDDIAKIRRFILATQRDSVCMLSIVLLITALLSSLMM